MVYSSTCCFVRVEVKDKAIIFKIETINSLIQCFPNCVPRHTGVPLKRLKCAPKVLF